MKTLSRTAILVAGAVVLAATGGVNGAAAAQAQSNQTAQTPKSWNYEIKDGKRVPKGNRTTNADGSWREEIRQGKCVTIKESSSQGELKITRRCD